MEALCKCITYFVVLARSKVMGMNGAVGGSDLAGDECKI